MHIFKFEFTLIDTVFTAKFETKKVTGCSNKMLIRIVQSICSYFTNYTSLFTTYIENRNDFG